MTSSSPPTTVARTQRSRVWQLVTAGSMAGLLTMCSSEPRITGGSETHFLRYCESDCPSGLVCECGVCTNPCETAVECAGWATGAECVASDARVATLRCPSVSSPAFCDLSCLTDADCAPLGARHECQSGYCREAGTEPPTTDPEPACAPPPLAASDLVVIGDSLLTLSIFTSELEAAAVAAGGIELGPDEHLRDYSSPITSMLAEGQLSLTNQYATSREDGPARVVIMDGGATDMLQDACPSGPEPECPAVQAAVLGAERLLAQMADDGVEHVVYFFYQDATENVALREGIDVLRPLIQNVCGRSPVPCHWLDLRPVFEGHYEDYATGVDGIVFSDAGARATAQAIWDFVEERCIAP